MSGSDPTTARQLREHLVSPAITAIESATSEITGVLGDIREQNRTVSQQMEQLASEQGYSGTLSSYPFNLSVESVPAGTTQNDPVVERREVPYDATITQVYIDSTDAASQRVGAQLSTSSGRRYIPRDPDSEANFVPLDKNTIEVTLNVDVDEGDDIEMRYANNDTEDHFARAIVVLKEQP